LDVGHHESEKHHGTGGKGDDLSIAGQGTCSPNAQRLIDGLDFEIRRADDISKRSGLTRWSLLAAVGAILWLLSHQFEKADFSGDAVAISFLLFAVVHGLWCPAKALLLAPLNHAQGNERRFILTSTVLNGSQTYLLFAALRAGGIAALSLKFALGYASHPTYLIVVLYGLSCLLHVAMLGISFVQVPIPLASIKRQHVLAKATAVAVILLMALGLAGPVTLMFAPGIRMSISAGRVAGLLFVVLLLVDWIVKNEASGQWPVSTLVAIRRDYSLGNLTLGQAWEQYEATLEGATTRGILQANLENLMELQRTLAKQCKLVAEEYDKLEAKCGLVTQSKCDEESLCASCGSLLKKTSSHISEAERTLGELRAEAQRFWGRAKLLMMFSPQCFSEVERLVDKLGDHRGELEEAIEVARCRASNFVCPKQRGQNRLDGTRVEGVCDDFAK